MDLWGFRWWSAICRSTRDIESGESRLRASELGCDCTRRTRSFLSTAREVSGLDPASDIGRVAQFRVSNHSIGAANSRATSHNTEFNVLGRSSDVAARCGPGIQPTSAGPTFCPTGSGKQSESSCDGPRVQEAAGSSGSRSRIQPRGHFRRQRGGVRLAHRRRARTRWPWRSRRALCWRDRDVVSSHSDERAIRKSSSNLTRRESRQKCESWLERPGRSNATWRIMC